jgi:hypothetical protein
MPSLTLKGNFKRGWPNPHIVEKVAQADSTCNLASGTPLLGFMGGHLNGSGAWVLGVSAISQQAYIFRNGVDEADAGRAATISADYIQAGYGGIQGISFDNPILVETVQFSGTPAVDTEIYCDTDGLFKAASSTKVVIARVDETSHPYQGVSYLTLRPVAPYVKA